LFKFHTIVLPQSFLKIKSLIFNTTTLNNLAAGQKGEQKEKRFLP
jgi:hypothetical protein